MKITDYAIYDVVTGDVLKFGSSPQGPDGVELQAHEAVVLLDVAGTGGAPPVIGVEGGPEPEPVETWPVANCCCPTIASDCGAWRYDAETNTLVRK